MFAFIAHAEADQAAADELKAFLKLRGLVTETETGAKGFRHLQASDVVIALWSQKSVFATYRMQIERRMLDAWADGRLVLVKLDHSFLPVGLRDLPAIDASFESSRQLSVWPQVERAAKEAMNRALVEKEKGGAGPGSLDSRYGDMIEAMEAPSPSRKPGAPQASEVSTAPKAKRGLLFPMLLVLLAVLVFTGSAWLLRDPGSVIRLPLPLDAIGAPSIEAEFTNLQAAMFGGVIGGALVLSVFTFFGRGSSQTRSASKARKASARPAEAAQAATAVGGSAAAPASTALFISYSHADNAAVEPVVAIVEKSGRTVWMDKTGIQTGDGWAGEIVRAIKSAKGILVMCSKHAFESDHVKREIYLADRYKKPMAPVFLEAAQPPEDFEYFFAGVQWLELYKLPVSEHSAAIGKALLAV
jgi:hypothetical protein